MLKKIEPPKIPRDPDNNFEYTMTLEYFDRWFDEHIEPLNRLIENAVEVYGGPQGKENPLARSYSTWEREGDDMKAYLIGIEPIKQESCADILKRYFKLKQDGLFYDLEEDWERKAKAALERESE